MVIIGLHRRYVLVFLHGRLNLFGSQSHAAHERMLVLMRHQLLLLEAYALEVRRLVEVNYGSLKLLQHQKLLVLSIDAQEVAEVRVRLRRLLYAALIQFLEKGTGHEYLNFLFARLRLHFLLLNHILHVCAECNSF